MGVETLQRVVLYILDTIRTFKALKLRRGLVIIVFARNYINYISCLDIDLVEETS